MAEGGLELAEEDGSLLLVVPVEPLAPLQQRFELPVVLPDQGQRVHAHPSRFGRHHKTAPVPGGSNRSRPAHVPERLRRRLRGPFRSIIDRSEDHGAYGAMVSAASASSTRS